MKTLHLQIFAAAMAAAFVATGIVTMGVYSSKKTAEARAQKAEADLKTERARLASIPAGKKPLLGVDPDKEKRDLVSRVRTLEARVKQLEADNAALRGMLPQTGQAPQKPVPGSAYGTGAAPPEIVVGGRDLPPPPPPEPGHDQPWGAAEDSEMDEMTAAVKLNPEQRQAITKIIMTAQSEYEAALAAAEKAGQARDMSDLERIGMQVAERTGKQIEQVLFPEQIPLFREFVKPRDEAPTPGEPAPPPVPKK